MTADQGTATAPVTQPQAATQTDPSPATDASSDAKEIPAAVAKEIRRLKLKMDGKEEELPEDEVIKLAQLGKKSTQRFNEAAQMRKQAEQFLAMLKTDPKSVLSDPRVGVDLRKFAEQIVWEKIQEETLTPEQKKAREIEAELTKYRDDEKARAAKDDEAKAAALNQKYAQDYDKRITAALQTANLPKTPMTVKRMAEYMFQAVQNGYDLEPADLVEQVRKDYIEDVKALFEQTDGDLLLSILGEGTAKKIRDTDLKRLKSTQGSPFSTPSGKVKSDPKPPKKLSGSDWRANLIKEARGR